MAAAIKKTAKGLVKRADKEVFAASLPAESAGVLTAGNLAKVFSTCRPFAGVRAPLPVMGHFLLSPTTVAATDGRVGIVHDAAIGNLSATMPVEMAAQLAASFPPDMPVSIVQQDGGGTRVHIGRHVATLGGFPVEDFPSIKLPAKEMQKRMPAGMYAAATQVAFSAAQDESRVQLNGVWFGKDATAMATDGYRLAWRRAAGAKEMFVPAWLLERVAGWQDAPERYAIDKAGKLWWFYADRAVFTTVPEISFPDCTAMISTAEKSANGSPGFTADREAFLAALRRILLLAAGQECCPVRLTISKTNLRMETKDPGTGHAMVEDIPAKALRHTKDAVGSVNARYLLRAVEHFDEFYLDEGMLIAFAEDRAFGHIIMRVRDTS